MLTPAEEYDAQTELIQKMKGLGWSDNAIQVMLGNYTDIEAANPGATGEPSLPVPVGNLDITATTAPVYEYSDVWAEESGNVATNSTQYSYGNGDTGFIGLPFSDGWEIYEDYMQSDTGGSAAESLSFEVLDIQNGAVTAAPVFHTFSITAAGQGQDNNAFILNDYRNSPIPVPDGAVPVFRSDVEVGAWAGNRLGLRVRRQVGVAVTDVLVNGASIL